MVRYITVAATLSVIASGAIVAYNELTDPMKERRRVLETKLKAIEPADVQYTARSLSNAPELHTRLVGNQKMWEALVPPPPPPKPKPKPVKVEKPPDLAAMLRGVVPTRQQIGRGTLIRVKIKVPGNARGSWMGVGDELKGLTIVRIEKGSVRFSLTKNGKKYTHDLPR